MFRRFFFGAWVGVGLRGPFWAMSGLKVDFRHAPTLRRAMLSDSWVKVVQGPVESGKSVYSLMQIYYWALTMPRSYDGIRRSRFLIHRTTEGELIRGIMRTAANLFPEDVYGKPQGSMPAIHKMKFLDVETEWEYFAFEEATEAVLKKLRSTEYTGALINEGQFVDQKLFLAIWQRMGRYPPKPLPNAERPNPIACPGYDKKRRAVMDMNAPHVSSHWVLRMRGDVPLPATMPRVEKRKYNVPPGWDFFKQPPVVLPIYGGDDGDEIVDFKINPDAENLPYQNLDEILAAVSTGELDDVRRDYMNEVVQAKSGSPRYPDFRRSFNVAKGRIEPVKDAPVILGYDPGVNGAVVFFQKINGQWRAIKEIICRNNAKLGTASAQGAEMKRILTEVFPWYRTAGITAWGDPYGTRQMVDSTYFDTVAQYGITFEAPTAKDDPKLRRETAASLLKRSDYGVPSLLICPIGCPVLVEAFDGGAVMKTVKKEGELHVREELNKDSLYADPIEAAEYAFWGGGEDNAIVEKPAAGRPSTRHDTVTGRSPVYGTSTDRRSDIYRRGAR